MNWNSLPPLGALRAFAAYAETGSVSRAGDALNVSHAAISQQVRSLEKHLGLALLDRTGRSMTLTGDGQRLADAALDGLRGIAETIERLTGAEEERPLRISTTPMFAASWLMPRLAGFRAGHLGIGLLIDPSSHLVRLEPGGVDLAIRYGDGNWPGLDAHLLVPSPIVIVGKVSLVGKTGPLNQAELSALPWLQELGTTEATSWLSRNGAAICRPSSITEAPGNLLIDALRRGDGIAAVARAFVQQDLDRGDLVVLDEDDTPNGYWLLTRKDAHRPALKAFINWIRRVA